MSILKLIRGNRLKIQGTRGDVNVFIRLLKPNWKRWGLTGNTNKSIRRGTNMCSNPPLLNNIEIWSTLIIKNHMGELVRKSNRTPFPTKVSLRRSELETLANTSINQFTIRVFFSINIDKEVI